MQDIYKEILLDNADLLYYQKFISDTEIVFDQLKANLKWRQDDIKMFGKIYKIPRLQAWYGDEGMEYSYSGIKMNPLPWTDDLWDIKNLIEQKTGFQFNSVLANLYRDGQDSNGWHADNEKELGKNPVIASISLGQERIFQMKHRQTKEKFKILLENGSLLVMKGETQHYWLHQIAKSKRITEERINLTFRKII